MLFYKSTISIIHILIDWQFHCVASKYSYIFHKTVLYGDLYLAELFKWVLFKVKERRKVLLTLIIIALYFINLFFNWMSTPYEINVTAGVDLNL